MQIVALLEAPFLFYFLKERNKFRKEKLTFF